MRATVIAGHGWARTRGTQERPYALAPLLTAVAIGGETLAVWGEISERTIRRLGEVGLTETQALILAEVAGVCPGAVWPELGS